MFDFSRRLPVMLAGLAVALGVLTGCGGGGGDVIRVGSKEFTEQLLLGQITILALEDAGFRVEDKTGIAGSNKLRTALLHRDIDVYWEYTGTGWLSHLQHDTRLSDPQSCYDAVKAEDAKNGIAWLRYAPINNTYTVMMRRARMTALGVHNLSELAAVSAPLSFAVDHEFTARPDGLPGLIAAYGFQIREDRVLVMDNAIIYKALKDDQADVGMGFATDGRIQAFDLVNIDDDKKFFPAYNPAPNVRTAFASENPKIVAILERISTKLDNPAILHMNYLVDIEQKVPRDVARAWLKEVGLIRS